MVFGYEFGIDSGNAVKEQATSIRTVLVEDQGIVREAIRHALSGYSWIKVVGEAATGVTAIDIVTTLKPDLVILDLLLPGVDGTDIIALLKRRSPDTRIVVLSGLSDANTVRRCLHQGADAFVAKAGRWSELETAITEALDGHRYVSPAAARACEPHETAPTGSPRLTDRERQVLKLLAEGHTNQKIGGILGISVKTVERHRENLMTKLRVRTPLALAAIALREGLIVSAP